MKSLLTFCTVAIFVITAARADPASVTVPAKSRPHSSGTVRINGNSLRDDGGPFLGLGATYMSALWKCKYDRTRLKSDLSFLSSKGFNYVRILSMVGWSGKEIAPIGFTNSSGTSIPAWPDYWQQLRDLIDLVDQHGMRTEVTIFADAQNCMPNKTDRINHMRQILNNLAGRKHKVMLLEVANEAWQNGFPGKQGVSDLREFGRYLADRTDMLVALSAPVETNSATVEQQYRDSAADSATIHFSRDVRTSEDGWLPVRDCWDAYDAVGIPPVSSNEPIGPGSSVASETDPIKLVSAAAFAWTAKLPMYVFHSEAGVGGDRRFEDMAGINDFRHLTAILPPDLPNWVRSDGKEPSSTFTVYCSGQPNWYWTDVSGATTGCHRNIGAKKGKEFVCYPMGILAGGVRLEARQLVTFKVYNPMTGAIVVGTTTKKTGEQFTLPQGPGAYIIKGVIGKSLPKKVNG